MHNSKLTSYGDQGFSRFIRKAFNRHLGYSMEDMEKPIIGICNTYSEINRCHSHVKPLINAVKHGILMAGGIPLEFPVISLGEINTFPTTMLYRNLLSMDVEEMIRAQPIDGVVLVGGCDKMSPGLLMGAASSDIPTVLISGGPMRNGEYKGVTLGACSDCRHYWQEYRAGNIDKDELNNINAELAPTAGHCMVMGSASTISVCAEAMGIMLSNGATIPATNNERLKHCMNSGKAIVDLVEKKVKFSDIVTEKSIKNGLTALLAVGGSTNTIIHLIAIARRLNIKISLDEFDKASKVTPIIGNIRPIGKYQMEDFHKAGGVPVLLKELEGLIYKEQKTVSGETIYDIINNSSRKKEYEDIIKEKKSAIFSHGGLAILKGNLAPKGAIIKHAAAKIKEHKGPALIFENVEDMTKRIDSEDLAVTENTILVLRNTGPVGGPGMPEAGYIPIPKKLLEQGVKDMVRISDARMSGTAFGTVILHVAPESSIGGPLYYLKDGDMIEYSLSKKSINVLISDEELKKRIKSKEIPKNKIPRGYQKMYVENVLQADEGCDFSFL